MRKNSFCYCYFSILKLFLLFLTKEIKDNTKAIKMTLTKQTNRRNRFPTRSHWNQDPLILVLEDP